MKRSISPVIAIVVLMLMTVSAQLQTVVSFCPVFAELDRTAYWRFGV